MPVVSNCVRKRQYYSGSWRSKQVPDNMELYYRDDNVVVSSWAAVIVIFPAAVIMPKSREEPSILAACVRPDRNAVS